jgi:hypothetical protein
MSTPPSDDTATDYQKYIDAIRAGGFVCLLPQIIDPSWRNPAQLLAGFPFNVCYLGLSEQASNCQPPPAGTVHLRLFPAPTSSVGVKRAPL